MYFMTILFSK